LFSSILFVVVLSGLATTQDPADGASDTAFPHSSLGAAKEYPWDTARARGQPRAIGSACPSGTLARAGDVIHVTVKSADRADFLKKPNLH